MAGAAGIDYRKSPVSEANTPAIAVDDPRSPHTFVIPAAMLDRFEHRTDVHLGIRINQAGDSAHGVRYSTGFLPYNTVTCLEAGYCPPNHIGGMAGGNPPLNDLTGQFVVEDAYHQFMSRFLKHRVTLALVMFLIAFGVRALTWHDTRLEVGKVQTTVAVNYQHVAQLLSQEGIRGFFSSSSPLADTNHLGHPPGYSILISFVRAILGDSGTAVQFVQIIFDALSAVLIFLIVAELVSSGAGLIAGLMAAFSPQLAWNSVLLLPDSLAVFPILLAVYLLAISRKHPRLLVFVAVGALVGISCWLRANALLMTLFFAAAVLACPKYFSLSKPIEGDTLRFVGPRWRSSLAIVFGTLLIVLPLTVRNAMVFHRFIPLSLGAGQTLLEGIADYDKRGEFNIPATDLGIVKQEAESFQRPDYNRALLEPDGIQRERKVIAAHPLWFSGVMIRRAASMVRLERTRLLSTNPSVTHPTRLVDQSQVVWSMKPVDLAATATAGSDQVKASLAPDGRALSITGDDSSYGTQFIFPPAHVRAKTDYLFTVPIRIEQGRMKISVTEANGRVIDSAIIETVEGAPLEGQPFNLTKLAFVANHEGAVRLVLSNEASTTRPMIQVGDATFYQLGPARFLWTRYPRLLVHGIQKLFLTAIFLPLAVFGLAILILRKRRDALIILSVVPLSYFCVQSIFHTEYRYVLAVNYFVFAFAAVGISWMVKVLIRLVKTRFVPLGTKCL
jgi:hypothetical protein